MPIYEYHCLACRKNFEALLLSSNEKVVCKSCGSKHINRLISRVAIKATMGDNSYPYVEHNFGDEPMVINSPDERRSKMKELRLVDLPCKRGESGQWV